MEATKRRRTLPTAIGRRLPSSSLGMASPRAAVRSGTMEAGTLLAMMLLVAATRWSVAASSSSNQVRRVR